MTSDVGYSRVGRYILRDAHVHEPESVAGGGLPFWCGSEEDARRRSILYVYARFDGTSHRMTALDRRRRRLWTWVRYG